MTKYSERAQPFLDALANAVFNFSAIRNWIVAGTKHEAVYTGSGVLTDEQREVRWRKKPTKQPYWANYFCGKDSRCRCRIEGSKSLESDAIFFFREAAGRVLAVHVEFKREGEPFLHGQPEGYPLRAKCFAETHSDRPALNAHDDWMTVVFCGDALIREPKIQCFDRAISHAEAAKKIALWPK